MPWPFGKPRPQSTKDAIAAALAGRPKSEAHKAAMSEVRRGKKRGKYRKLPTDQQ